MAKLHKPKDAVSAPPKRKAKAARSVFTLPPEPPPPKEVNLEEEEAKPKRAAARRGFALVETLGEIFAFLGAGEDTDVAAALEGVRSQLDRHQPPAPRTCKEHKRALALAKKGLMGIHPDDVLRFCRCEECHGLREKAGMEHPLEPKGLT